MKNTLFTNDFDMYYEIHGKGEPLLVLHGFTGSGARLVSLYSSFADRFQLIIPDLRGHGRSTNPSKKFTHYQAAQDILALLEHLDIKKCKTIGFSAGGNILLHIARQEPSKIQRMAIVSATPYFPAEARELMHQYAIKEKTKEEWDEMRKIHFQGDEQIAALWQQATEFYDNHDDMNFDSVELAKITAKTLIVQGDRDPLYPIELSVKMYRAIPDAYLWVIPNGGHVPIVDDFVQPFNNYLLKFILN